MHTSFITVSRHEPPDHHTDISLAPSNILAVTAPRRVACGRYYYIAIYCHNPQTIEVTGSEEEMLRLYSIITEGKP